MVTAIKKGASKKEIKALFERLVKESNKKKGFDSYKFCGLIKLKEDALNIQKQLRDEWE